MATQTLERPATINIHSVRQELPSDFEPNFGPSDIHAITAIALIMNGIFTIALVMYSCLAVAAYFRAGF